MMGTGGRNDLRSRARLADPDAEPAAVAAVIDLALGDSDARFIHEAGRLRLADCSS